MTHQRNIDGLRKSAQQRSEVTRQRVEAAIGQLQRANRPVNFRTVAKIARVSTAYLYQHTELQERIVGLRAAGVPSRTPPPKARATDASHKAKLATLIERIKRLEADNRDLKQQLEVAYGRLATKK